MIVSVVLIILHFSSLHVDYSLIDWVVIGILAMLEITSFLMNLLKTWKCSFSWDIQKNASQPEKDTAPKSS